MSANLVPFPRVKFLVPTAPTVGELFSPNLMMAKVKPGNGKFLSASVVFRGDMPLTEAWEKIDEYKRNNGNFVEWLPYNLKGDVIETGSDMSVTTISNTTAPKDMFRGIAQSFGDKYRNRSKFGEYLTNDMDAMELQEADKDVRDLITEYQDKDDATINIGGEADEEGEF